MYGMFKKFLTGVISRLLVVAIIVGVASVFVLTGVLFAGVEPLYISKMPLADYTLFATAGWDGNWYVGSNQSWIERIKISSDRGKIYKPSDFKRAYVGVKLGRMKSEQIPGKPTWIRKPYPGSIYCAVASSPSWKEGDYFLVTMTDDIPLQYDYENAIKEVGESRWFWTEIPLEKLNFQGDNYVIVWSGDEYLNSASSAPILAAAWGTKDVDTWINTNINPSGKPSLIKSGEDPLKTPVTIFEPAIALKLIPASYDDKSNDGTVEIMGIEEISPSLPLKKVHISIDKIANIEKVWLEATKDIKEKKWEKISRYIYNPPYIFSLDTRDITYRGKIFIRAVVEDIYGARRFSRDNFALEISTGTGK